MTKTAMQGDRNSAQSPESSTFRNSDGYEVRHEYVDGACIITDERLPGRELRVVDDDGVWEITREGENGEPDTARIQVVEVESLHGSEYREIIEEYAHERYGSHLSGLARKLSWPISHRALRRRVIENFDRDPDDPDSPSTFQPVAGIPSDDTHDFIRFVVLAHAALFDLMTDICAAHLAAQTPKSKLQITRNNGKLDWRMKKFADMAIRNETNKRAQ